MKIKIHLKHNKSMWYLNKINIKWTKSYPWCLKIWFLTSTSQWKTTSQRSHNRVFAPKFWNLPTTHAISWHGSIKIDGFCGRAAHPCWAWNHSTFNLLWPANRLDDRPWFPLVSLPIFKWPRFVAMHQPNGTSPVVTKYTKFIQCIPSEN